MSVQNFESKVIMSEGTEPLAGYDYRKCMAGKSVQWTEDVDVEWVDVTRPNQYQDILNDIRNLEERGFRFVTSIGDWHFYTRTAAQACPYCRGTGNSEHQVRNERGWYFLKCGHCKGTGKKP